MVTEKVRQTLIRFVNRNQLAAIHQSNEFEELLCYNDAASQSLNVKSFSIHNAILWRIAGHKTRTNGELIARESITSDVFAAANQNRMQTINDFRVNNQ